MEVPSSTQKHIGASDEITRGTIVMQSSSLSTFNSRKHVKPKIHSKNDTHKLHKITWILYYVRNVGLKQEGWIVLWKIFANVEGRLKANEKSIK